MDTNWSIKQESMLCEQMQHSQIPGNYDKQINPFHGTSLFLYPEKSFENL